MVCAEAERLLAVLEDVDHVDVGDAVGGDERSAGQQDGPPVLGEHLDDRQLGLRLRVPGRLELLALHEPESDPHRDDDEDGAEQERNAPAPREELLVGHRTWSQQEHEVGEEHAGRDADLRRRAVEARAALAGRVRWPSAPRRPTRRRRRCPGRSAAGTSRTGAARRSRRSWAAGRSPTVATPMIISEVTSIDLRPILSPKWPMTMPPRAGRRSRRRGSRTRRGCSANGRAAGEELLAEHERGGGAVDEEVVPLDRGADETPQRGPARDARVPYARGRPTGPASIDVMRLPLEIFRDGGAHHARQGA